MVRNLQIITTDTTDPYYNLALEQQLLETVPRETCILYLWQNRNTVVIGCNQNPWLECRTTRLEEDGGFLARRLSGGGAVYHDMGNLNFTFLVRQEEYDVARQLSVIVEACRGAGIAAQRSGRNDVLVDGRKFSGNAFYAHQGCCYHHGTLLVDVDMEKMGRYLKPSPAKLQAKGVASVRSRVVNLKELNRDLTVSDLRYRMAAAFETVYGLPAGRLYPQELDQRAVQALAERNRSWEWRYGRELPFTFQCAGRFDWGEVTLRLAAEGGVVREAAVYTDAMDWNLAKWVEMALPGRRFAFRELAAAVEETPVPEEIRRDLIRLLSQQEI